MSNEIPVREDHEPLALPAPDTRGLGSTPQLDISNSRSQSQPINFDALGPMVVNSDGTLSRIANWSDMTELERQRTFRVLSARNKIRLKNEEKQQEQNPNAAKSDEKSDSDSTALSIVNDDEQQGSL